MQLVINGIITKLIENYGIIRPSNQNMRSLHIENTDTREERRIMIVQILAREKIFILLVMCSG